MCCVLSLIPKLIIEIASLWEDLHKYADIMQAGNLGLADHLPIAFHLIVIYNVQDKSDAID